MPVGSSELHKFYTTAETDDLQVMKLVVCGVSEVYVDKFVLFLKIQREFERNNYGYQGSALNTLLIFLNLMLN